MIISDAGDDADATDAGGDADDAYEV